MILAKQKNAYDEIKRFLQDLAASLIFIETSRIGDRIETALSSFGKFCRCKDILLAEFNGAEKAQIVGGVGPLAKRLEDMPWVLEQVRQGRLLSLNNGLTGLPKEAKKDKSTCKEAGISSLIAVPAIVDKHSPGVLMATFVQDEKPLTNSFVDDFQYFATLLSQALRRKDAAKRSIESDEFEHLLSEISAKYINMPFDEIEDVARNDFHRLASLLNVDRCLLHVYDEEHGGWMEKGVPNTWLKASWFSAEDGGSTKDLEEYVHEDARWSGKWKTVFDMWNKGKIHKFTHCEENDVHIRDIFSSMNIKSGTSVPIFVGGKPAGAIAASTTRSYRIWPDNTVPRLRLFGEVFINALQRKKSEKSLRDALVQVERLKEQLQADYTYLRNEIKQEHDFQNIVGNSRSLNNILLKAKQVASTDVTVLILGETGTGKGLIARAIHDSSKRKERPLIQVNCAALAPTLIESELFGYEKGAFTGAHARKIGRFEMAQGTTLFLDEIGEMPLDLQAKLLRVLQDGEFERVGGTMTIKSNVRIIAATNKNLEKEAEAGRFRLDLWYRLNVFPIHVPPLRERTEDIPLFVNFFVDKYGKWIGRHFDTISQKTIKALQAHSWPGNIRELENTIERAVIASPEGHLKIEVPSQETPVITKKIRKLEDFERDYIIEVLERTYWKIQGNSGAAKLLGFKPSTLRTRMKKLNITRPHFQD